VFLGSGLVAGAEIDGFLPIFDGFDIFDGIFISGGSILQCFFMFELDLF
jgi:hypothetical protein